MSNSLRPLLVVIQKIFFAKGNVMKWICVVFGVLISCASMSVGAESVGLRSAHKAPDVSCENLSVAVDVIVCASPELLRVNKRLHDQLNKSLSVPYISKEGVLRRFSGWWEYERAYKGFNYEGVGSEADIKANYELMMRELRYLAGQSWRPRYKFYKDEDLIYEKDPMCIALLAGLNKNKYVAPYDLQGLPLGSLGDKFKAVNWEGVSLAEYMAAISTEQSAVHDEENDFWSYYLMLDMPAAWSGGTGQYKAVNKGGFSILSRGAKRSAKIEGADIFIFDGNYYSYVWSGRSPWLQVWRLDSSGFSERPNFGFIGSPWCQISTIK